jgi:radical SAM protein with 4Fe4S-binding SPASM domain
MLHGWEHLTAPERGAILRGVRDGTAYTMPYHVEISPTDACNYECFFCNSAFVDRSKRLPWDVLQKALLDLVQGGLKSIRLSGGGEPLIYPQIEEILDLCLEHRIAVSNVTTNAYRMTPKVIDRLLKLDTTEVIVSFNDIDPKLYALTNGTTERAFDVVLDNMRNLITERNRRGLKRPKVIHQFMLWKANHDRIETAYDLAESLGVDHIYVRDLWGISGDRRMNAQELAVAREGVRRLIARDAGRGFLILGLSNEDILPANEASVDTPASNGNGHNGSSKPRVLWRSDHPTRTEYCYIGWYSTVIRGNGEVFPCCKLATTEGYPALGNVKSQSMEEIWHGPQYSKLRMELRDIALREGEYDPHLNYCHALEFCTFRDACPFVKSLATPEFYEEVSAELQALRRRPDLAVRKVARSLAGFRPFVG